MHESASRLQSAFPAAVLFCCLVWVSPAGAAPDAGADGSLKLRYALEKLGNAVSTELSSPGAAGTDHCIELTHDPGSWSRFNWPIFAPVEGLNGVRFAARRIADRPQRFLVRILRDDGTEWQSEWAALEETWSEFRFDAGDFRLFRGGERETAGDLTFDRAIQFQVVPSSEGDGVGRFAVDEIRFLPDGPAFTADGEELQRRLSDVELDERRLADLVGRWRREEERLTQRTEVVRRWLAQLEALSGRWRNPSARQDVTEQFSRRGFAWQNQATPRPEVPVEPAGDSDFRGRVASLARQPETPVLDFAGAVQATGESLYAAVHPPDPRVETEDDGRPVLRHALAFTADETRQTVFTTVELPQEIDVSGRALLARMRLTPVVLNDEYPFLLRLWSRVPGGRESWADFRPDALPGTDWSGIRFDLSAPLRGVRFDPAKVWRLSIRMENVPGTPADFELAVDRVSLGWPAPAVRAREQILGEVQAMLYSKRLALYALRDRIARVEGELCGTPELWRLYTGSFAVHIPRENPDATPAKPLVAEMHAARTPVRAHLIRTRTSPGEDSAALRVECTDADVTAVGADLYSSDGLCVVSQRAAGPHLTLRVPRPGLWQPGRPSLYRLDCVALRGADVRAYDSREMGLHWKTVQQSPVQATLRHAVRRGWPDWSLHWNGRPYFPRMARYHWPELERTEREGIRMLADLWVDGQRQYGFAHRPDWWDFCDRSGIAEFASLAPSYRSLAGWGDIGGFRDAYTLRTQLAASQCDRPCHAAMQVGNEVELSVWGSDLSGAFPGALYHPLDMVAELIGIQGDPGSPIMYVRAGSFRQVPPLPHEEMCGVNQYTGRYSGRIDEIDRNLAELSMEAVFCDRPLLITEWNGPKYSWASSGVGGVSRRGAAYYLERYWRAMINTPGIVGSAEFTLNWVIAPFEDLTTQTREAAWQDRPKHHQFGGGYTADHVPLVAPDKAVRGPCFRSMQAFHGPLYPMVSTPGAIHVVAAADAGAAGQSGAAAARLTAALTACGKEVRRLSFGQAADLASLDGHIVALCPAGTGLPASVAALARAGVLESCETTATMQDEPVIQTVIHPGRPDCLLTVVTAGAQDAAARGGERLAAAAECLRDLHRAEGAMGRILAVVDPSLVRTYSAYILEQASRGFAFGGDDTRTSLDAAELFDSQQGGLRPAWHDLRAVILDTTRELSDAEAGLLDRLVELGVDLVISLPAYSASSALRDRYAARVVDRFSLSGSFPVAPALSGPLPLPDLGGAEADTIRAFRPDRADSEALQVAEFADAPDAVALVTGPGGGPAVLGWQRGDSHITLFGVAFGEAARIHWLVTHAGQSHRLYDRDTACGLERVSRAVVNACLLDAPAEADRPRLFLRIEPEKTLVQAGEPIRFTVFLADVEGRAVSGQLLARTRTVVDGSAGVAAPYADLAASSAGRFAVVCESAADLPGARSFVSTIALPYLVPSACERSAVVSVQFKAYAAGYTPADGAAAFAVALE